MCVYVCMNVHVCRFVASIPKVLSQRTVAEARAHVHAQHTLLTHSTKHEQRTHEAHTKHTHEAQTKRTLLTRHTQSAWSTHGKHTNAEKVRRSLFCFLLCVGVLECTYVRTVLSTSTTNDGNSIPTRTKTTLPGGGGWSPTPPHEGAAG